MLSQFVCHRIPVYLGLSLGRHLCCILRFSLAVCCTFSLFIYQRPRPVWVDRYMYGFITVTWSEGSDLVELQVTDHQIKRDTKRRVWSYELCLATRRDPTFWSNYCYNNIYFLPVFYVISSFSLYFKWIAFLNFSW